MPIDTSSNKSEFGDEIKDFIKASHKIAEFGLLKCSSGNLSCRLNEQFVAVSATGAWLGELIPEQIAICSMQDGDSINGVQPSIESVFHFGILNHRKDINVVLHFQSPYATIMASCNPEKYDFNVIIEIPVYIGKPSIIEAFPSGIPQLAEATVSAMKTSDMAILRNHGLVTVGIDYNDAIQKAFFFELACMILLVGKDVQVLPDKVVEVMQSRSKA
jgi:ribulose-5-phosphate 4-epimerase/fuculose-1-phosphate aldolase